MKLTNPILIFDDVSFQMSPRIKPKFWQKFKSILSRFVDFWKCKRNPNNFRNKSNHKCIMFHLHYNKAVEKSTRLSQ